MTPTLRLIAVAILMLAPSFPSAQVVTGVWEGEIQTQGTPTVATVDFDNGTATLGGGVPMAVTRRPDLSDTPVVFELTSDQRVLRFSATVQGGLLAGNFAGRSGQPIPFSLERLPILSAPRSRAEAWQQDLDVVATRFLRYDRSFDETTRTAARARLNRLARSVESLTDNQIVVELSRVIAATGNAHTRLYFARNRTEVSRLPVRVWWFGEELRIVRATDEHRDLLGCRVERIGARPIAEALRIVRDIKAGNASWQRYMSQYYLASPDILAGANVVTDPAQITLGLTCNAGGRDVTLSPLPRRRQDAPVEAWWDLAPVFAGSEPGLDAFALSASQTPRYLRHARENYWFEYVREDGVLYFQYNRANAAPSKPMNAFVTQLTDAVRANPVKALVVDLRFNTGGDLNVATPLVEALVPLLRGLPVFVFTGRATFSAGLTHAAQWKQLAAATIVGEPAADVLDFWSEGGNLVLPNSRLTVHYANGFHKYSQRQYPSLRPYYFELSVDSIVPDVPVEMTWTQYISGRDPLYESVRR